MLLTIVITILAVGCSHEKNSQESKLALIKTTNPQPLNISARESTKVDEKIEKDISSFEEIYDVAVIKGKKEILVAYKVKHMKRFGMKNIEKKINKLLEKKYPDENFIVSSDYKIFLEAVQLREDLEKPDFSTKKAQKRFERIINLKKELT
ncbi:YhcN/YlaJ family sporulation lipoprotein [Bacillus sp. cl95]|uniref:YhcN/YlaJ family sporulation lipoprotein n=2 Tax=unclassified Bacillus (in: firmicutes) TaxID=185979 RepID=UPI0020C85581|nr:YhcN/YlaJ family sporulation lipoprotein [Bacillus sp. cl95]